MAERLTADLYVDDVPRGVAVIVDGREVLRFTGEPPAIAAHLTLPNRSLVPVSRSPTTVVTTLVDAARSRRGDPAAWTSVLARHLSRRWSLGGHATHRADNGRYGPRSLAAVILAATHPALAPAIAASLDPMIDVPSWASPALRHDHPTAIGRQLFGSTTRTIDSALGALLTHPLEGRLPWWTLASAVAAVDAVEPDDVAAVLTARVFMEPMPVVDDVGHLRRLFGLLERDEVVRLLLDATHDSVRLTQLLDVARRSSEIARVPRSDRPRRLDELAAFVRSFARTQVAAAPASGRPAPVRAPTPGWRAARQAPERGRSAAGRFDELRTALDGYVVDDIVLEAPRSGDDLRAWASLLHNCLASFEPAVRSRRSLVLAVRRDGRLEAALEIDPSSNRLRQFHGPRNRAPSAATTSAVVRALREHGVTVG